MLMSGTTVMPGFPGAPQPPQKSSKRWLPWVIPVLAFILGVGVGGTGQQEDVTAAPAYVSLKSELTDTQVEADRLAEQVEAAEERIERATAAGEDRLAKQTAEVEARRLLLDQREQDLVAREAAAQAAAEAAASAPKPPPVAAKPSAQAPAPKPPAVQAPVAPAPQATSTYYKNCDAVRAAGAAPVRVGDPGYAGHLDRDGDGIGCE